MIHQFIREFDEVGPNDPIRIFELWVKHEHLTNVRCGLMVALTGFPVKKIEQYLMGLHKIGFSLAELANQEWVTAHLWVATYFPTHGRSIAINQPTYR
jgi:hypothetical protein